MKLRHNNKYYCISRCAKDKFQTYILRPFSLSIFLAVILLLSLLIPGFIGFIIEGIHVTWFEGIAATKIMTWVSVGYLTLLILALACPLVIDIYNFFKHTYKRISYKINKLYEYGFKPSCKLFEECD